MLILYSRERKLSWSIHRFQIEDQELITNSYAGSIGGHQRPKCHSFELKIPRAHVCALYLSNLCPYFPEIYARCIYLRHRVCVTHGIPYTVYGITFNCIRNHWSWKERAGFRTCQWSKKVTMELPWWKLEGFRCSWKGLSELETSKWSWKVSS